MGYRGRGIGGRPGVGAPILSLIAQALITVAMIVAVGTSDGHRIINEVLA